MAAGKEYDYRQEAKRDAAQMALHFLDEIVEQLKEKGTASDRLYHDYENGDEALDRYRQGGYSLHEAADVIEQLAEYEVDDEGLWQGLSPREAISVMAAETYANAIFELWRDLIDRINMAVGDNLDRFTVGPKEWSPHKKDSKLTEFVKYKIQSELAES